MRSKILLSLAIPALASSICIPQAFAGELGSAFQKTFEADQFTYTSSTDMTLEKNLAADMPFTMNLQVKEEGGKKSNNYAEKGSLTFRVSDVSELPAEFNDLSYVDVLAAYRADYEDATQTAYLLLDTLKVTTDGKEALVFTEMLNEIGKMYTGKAFRLSSQELMEVFSGPLAGFASPEDLMAFNTLGNNSVKDMVKAVGMALDGLVQSGVLVDRVTNDTSRRLRGSMGGQIHTLTLADSITPAQAEILRTTLMNFVETMMPALATEMNADLQYIPGDEFALEINKALAALQGAALRAEVTVASGVMHSLNVEADFSQLQMPLSMNMAVDFDYTTGSDRFVPRNPENVVDLNKIVEGFVQLFTLGTSSSFSTPSYDESWSQYDTNYYLVLDTIDVIQDHLWNSCGADRTCQRAIIKELQRNLRQLRDEGYILAQEYQWKLIELNSLR